MRLLIDTHVVLELVGPRKGEAEAWSLETIYVSVASLWEIAIMVRQGKLDLFVHPFELEKRLSDFGCEVLPVTGTQAVAEVSPWPETGDPFDRLLLAVCQVEDLKLVTRDRKLVGHPLAWKAAAG